MSHTHIPGVSDDVFNVVGTATESRKKTLPTKSELETALGLAHADAHILAELECTRIPDSPKSQYVRTRRVGPPSHVNKTFTLSVEDEFKCIKKGGSGGGPHKQTQEGEG
jgi:hypothetical protein